ncbi:MAG: pseudaminic acid synthase [Candidatus Omnitrophota bacterium]|nr:pseudaminic acid synthase [Candidatus Omnitrophota bacterium]
MMIQGRRIGAGQPCYVIAELSANHGGSLERALRIVRAAKEAGADAIKLQTYTADTMTLDVDNEYFRIKDGLWGGKNLYQLYQKASTPWEWHKTLKEEADKLQMHCFSTPFDETAVDFLESLGVAAYKIASFELVDDLLLIKVAHTRKPVIMSTGMATLEEIRHALQVLHDNGTKEIALLKCVSAYPAPAQEMHLRTMSDMRARFKCPVGLSDHTLGPTVAIAAVAVGAELLEKHIKLNQEDDTPDAVFSMTPEAFGDMVQALRLTESALGEVRYQKTQQEGNSVVFRRSIFVSRDIKKGEVFTSENIKVIRPGQGLSPKYYAQLLGRKAKQDISRGTPLSRAMM